MEKRRRYLGMKGAITLACGLWLTLFAWNTVLWSDDSRLDSVASSLAEARGLGGALLDPDRLADAELDLLKARELADLERGKSAPLRVFVGAERHLTRARREARRLEARSRSAFRSAHDGAEQTLSTAHLAVHRAVSLEGRVPLGRDTQLERVQMRREARRLTVVLGHAEKAFASGEPILAGSLARTVEREARTLGDLIDLSISHR
ncbi:MAG: hypothetical protein AAF725_00540 [Acidobacteriota bacterium]